MTDAAATAAYIAELRDDMTERMWRFCQLFPGPLCSGNATKAARLAGYEGDDATLAVTGYRLLRNDKVRAALAAFQEADAATAARIEHGHFLTRVMRGEEKEKRAVRDDKGNVTFEDCPPSLKDRLAAQEQLAKLGGYYVTKVANTNTAGEDLKSVPLAELLVLAGMGKTG